MLCRPGITLPGCGKGKKGLFRGLSLACRNERGQEEIRSRGLVEGTEALPQKCFPWEG